MLITVSDSDVDDDDGDMNNSNRGIYSVNCHYACMSNPFDRLKKKKESLWAMLLPAKESDICRFLVLL